MARSSTIRILTLKQVLVCHSGEEEYEESDQQSNGDKNGDDNDHNPNISNSARKKRERRSKDDSTKRNYICGCGKMYLSYAALYTHAKVKHKGIFPEGTTTLHKKKQGRPKVLAASHRKRRQPSRSSSLPSRKGRVSSAISSTFLRKYRNLDGRNLRHDTTWRSLILRPT
jgi:hypothetical protein